MMYMKEKLAVPVWVDVTEHFVDGRFKWEWMNDDIRSFVDSKGIESLSHIMQNSKYAGKPYFIMESEIIYDKYQTPKSTEIWKPSTNGSMDVMREFKVLYHAIYSLDISMEEYQNYMFFN